MTPHAAGLRTRGEVIDRRVDDVGLGIAGLVFAGCLPGWWWGGGGLVGMPLFGQLLTDAARRSEHGLVHMLHLTALYGFVLAAAVVLAWLACRGWLAVADLTRGKPLSGRYGSRTRCSGAAATGSPAEVLSPPACVAGHGVPGQPDSPLLAEMTAIQLHAAYLPHLASQERQPDAYQLFARRQIAWIMADWHVQTAGQGTIEDLFAPDTGRTTRRPSVVDGGVGGVQARRYSPHAAAARQPPHGRAA